MKKRGLLYTLISFLILPITYAADNLGDQLYEWLGFIAKVPVIGDLTDKQDFFIKFLLWIVVFTTVYYALRTFVFKEEGQNKYASILAIVIGIISVLGIPITVIQNLIQTYSTIVLLVLIGGPILGLYMVTKTLKESLKDSPRAAHIITAIFYWVLLVSIKSVFLPSGAVEAGVAAWTLKLTEYTQWVGFIFAFVEVMMFWHILAALFFSGKQSGIDAFGRATVGKGLSPGVSSIGSWIKGNLSSVVSKDRGLISGERGLTNKLKKIIKKDEKKSEDLAKEIDHIIKAIDFATANPDKSASMQPKILEALQNLLPNIRSSNNLQDFEDLKNKLDTFNTGYLALLNTELDEADTKLATIEAEDPPLDAKVVGGVKEYIQKLKNQKRDAEGITVELNAIKADIDSVKDTEKIIEEGIEDATEKARENNFAVASRNMRAVKSHEEKIHKIFEDIIKLVEKSRDLVSLERSHFRTLDRQKDRLVRRYKKIS